MYNKFLNFWINNIRISIVLIFFLIFYWFYSILDIKKEASPRVKLWKITISTVWNGVNPVDVDKLVTEKIEKNIINISEIDKINSVSLNGISIVNLLLKKDADSTKVMTKLQNNLSTIKFPNWVEKSKIKEHISDNNFVFELLLYWERSEFGNFELRQKAKELKNLLENNKNIEKVEIWWYRNIAWWKFLDEDDYKIKIILDKEKIEKLGLSIHSIKNAINKFNKNTSLWKHYIEWKWYNYYIWWKLKNPNDLLKIQINTFQWKIFLWDISRIKKEYPIYRERSLWIPNDKNNYNFISLLISKKDNLQVVEASKKIKLYIKKIFEKKDFKNLEYTYTKDLSYLIQKDFLNLYKTILITIILVFFILLIFIWFKESLISIILLPLSFLLTFILLNFFWISLNIMTNFSLIIAFGIMIDTIIVIIEWVSEFLKKGLSPKNVILNTFNKYWSSLISWNLTTLIAIFPMMFFPWIVWKFVSYIPITIFLAIISTMIVTFTVSIALFLRFKNSKNIENKSIYLKVIRKKRRLFLNKISNFYKKSLKNIIFSNKKIILWLLIPIILLILSIIFLSPRIGFTMFPDSDKSIITININTKKDLSKDYLFGKYWDKINSILNKKNEILFYYTTFSNNNIYSYLELKEPENRNKNIKKTVWEIFDELKNIWKNELDISVKAEKEWPTTSKNIGIELIANTPNDFKKLQKVANDFKLFLEKNNNFKNISISTQWNSWTFKFFFDKERLEQIWLTQQDITRELYFYINWLNAWNIKSNLENNAIVIYLDWFDKKLNPEKIENLIITTKKWKIRVWDFLNYDLINSVTKITRDNWKISISVNANVKDISKISILNKQLLNYTKKYNFPEWVYLKQSWEIEKNKEILDYTLKSFLIAISLIFLLFVYQFKSYSQSILILYSIVITILAINIWLFLFWKPYSMPFLIWFIALAWIVVNDSIILVDSLNEELTKSNIINRNNYIEKIIEISWKRLYPIIITTLTTILWIFPLFFQWSFWQTFSITVVFWLTLWSFMTLIIIPIFYKKFYFKRFLIKKETEELDRQLSV